MDRHRVYFSLTNRTYYTNPHVGPWNFELNIDRQALDVFEKIFQQMQLLELKNIWRSQLPYVPYHLDSENDEIDLRLKNYMHWCMSMGMLIQKLLWSNYRILINVSSFFVARLFLMDLLELEQVHNWL